MHQLAYISRARDGFEESALPGLMRLSRRNNQRTGLTGMLLVEWPYFLQVIEGSKSSIDDLMARLHADTRHDSIEVIYEQPELRARQFGRWQMGCKILGGESGSNFKDLDGRVRSVLRRASANRGEAAHQLLLDYRRLEASYVEI